MSLLQPHTISDVNVFLDGQGFLGVIKELNLPVLEKDIRMQENAGLTRPVDLGLFKELKIEFTMQQLSAAVPAWLATGRELDSPLIFKAGILEGAETKEFLSSAKGLITKYELPSLGPKVELEAKLEIALNFFSVTFNGEQLMLFDTENAVAVINGVDLLAETRSALL